MRVDLRADAPSNSLVLLAFAAVYTIWGSTYLAIRVAVETLPPLMMAGTRYMVAGGILYLLARRRGAPRATRQHWRSTLIIGGLLLLGGNGGVCWAEQYVPSGITALMVTAVPLWMVLLNWLRPGGVRPGLLEGVGFVLGFAGVLVLVDPWSMGGASQTSVAGTVVLLVAPLFWAMGSLYSRTAVQPSSPLLSIAMQMLCGGTLLLVVGALMGEVSAVNVSAITVKSILAWAYLIVFGALIGFTAYIWLLRVSTPSRVSTYAYVNPVIAVLLGWALLSEPLTSRTFLAAAVIITGVVLITTQSADRPRSKVAGVKSAESCVVQEVCRDMPVRCEA